MDGCRIVHTAVVRKEHLLGKRQKLVTEKGPRKKARIWLSEEEKVAHAWVAACDAGDMHMVELMLPLVENTALGVNCADGAGVTGLMAGLEKARLEVVDRLLGHKDTNMDFTQTDTRGRNALDLVILSPSDHFMHLILHGLKSNCIDKNQELEKVLLPRILSCVSLGKHGLRKFKKMLDYFNVNFKEGALLSFLIIAGNVMFIELLAKYCLKKGKEVTITKQNRRSLLYALRTGRHFVVSPLFSCFPHTFGKQLESILNDPLPVLGTAARVEAVKKSIFAMLTLMIQSDSPSLPKPLKLDSFEIGINCIDVNETDHDGNTLLMMAVIESRPLYAKLLLAKESLKVNKVNYDGFSALDFLPNSPAISDQLVMVDHFLERQAAFNDVDFSNIDDDMPILANTIQENKLDYADILLDCSSYHPSPLELATARDILTLGKRVLLFYPKEGSADKKKTLLKLLYKVEMKEKGTKDVTHIVSQGRKLLN